MLDNRIGIKMGYAFFCLTTFLNFGYGLVLNETAVVPPRVELFEHKTAQFGMQTNDPKYERYAHLVVISPADGCGNIINWHNLTGAIVLVKRGSCAFITQAKNVWKYGGIGMIVGNKDETLNPMTGLPSYDLDIPCVSVANSTYEKALSKLTKQPARSVIATLSSELVDTPRGRNVVEWLLFALLAFSALFRWGHWPLWERWWNCSNQRERRIRTRDIPEVSFTKDLLCSDVEDLMSLRKTRLKNDVCPICLGSFHEQSRIKLISCHHGFHAECIGPWIARNCSCPICRHEIKVLVAENHRRSWCKCNHHCFCWQVSSEEQVDQPLLLSASEEQNEYRSIAILESLQ